jgi:glutathione reductase (NADPH)
VTILQRAERMLPQFDPDLVGWLMEKFRAKSRKAPDWYTALRVAEPTYGFKVLVEEKSDRVLGAHLLGPHVDEVINVFVFAIRQGLTAEALRTTMFAYPTGASDIGYML